jgi:hypothetical protein
MPTRYMVLFVAKYDIIHIYAIFTVYCQNWRYV